MLEVSGRTTNSVLRFIEQAPNLKTLILDLKSDQNEALDLKEHSQIRLIKLINWKGHIVFKNVKSKDEIEVINHSGTHELR